jgi:hypothetical protein
MSVASRTARIFLSSTFRDFGEERDLLVRRVFPALRARLKDRFVELVDVDLRWGITPEQTEVRPVAAKAIILKRHGKRSVSVWPTQVGDRAISGAVARNRFSSDEVGRLK